MSSRDQYDEASSRENRTPPNRQELVTSESLVVLALMPWELEGGDRCSSRENRTPLNCAAHSQPALVYSNSPIGAPKAAATPVAAPTEIKLTYTPLPNQLYINRWHLDWVSRWLDKSTESQRKHDTQIWEQLYVYPAM